MAARGLLLNVSPSTHVASISEQTTTLARRRRWRDIQVTYAESRVGPIPDAVEAGRACKNVAAPEEGEDILLTHGRTFGSGAVGTRDQCAEP